jgi:hypothetical protein
MMALRERGLPLISSSLGLTRPSDTSCITFGWAKGARRSYSSFACLAMNCLTMRSSSE